MRYNYRTKAFKLWLDKLQQESWQLELIISGFSIYGLSQAFEPLTLYLNIAKNELNTVVVITTKITLISCYILMFTLLLHVILRGLWIGALGLRYVSGDIDYKQLNYRPKFNHYLRKRIGSFDRYISRLEDYCSILFAVSFLLIFYVLSFFLVIGAIALIDYSLLNDGSTEETETSFKLIIGVILMTFIIVGMLLTFIDFITQGFLKKKKWLATIYFPFYWVFSFITLSFLYRPLVYNFLDNKFGKRLSLILVPIYFIIVVAISFKHNRSNYFSLTNNSNSFTANSGNYDENITEKGMFVKNASIPSKIITTNYLPVFIEYKESVEDAVFSYNKALKPEDDIRGFKSDIVIAAGANYNSMFSKKRDSLKRVYMKTLSTIYSFKIDSLEFNTPDFLFTNHNNQNGFETVLPIKKMTEGKHLLEIFRLKMVEDSIGNSIEKNNRVITIPFWYYKD